MAKLTFLFATFALFLLLANATLHATIKIDAENPQEQGQGQGQGKGKGPMQCYKEFKEQKELSACKRYIRKQITPRHEDIFLEDETDASVYRNGDCCQEVKQIDPACRCFALRLAATQVLANWRGHGQPPPEGLSLDNVRRITGNIPKMCHTQPQSCPWSGQTMGLEMVTDFEE